MKSRAFLSWFGWFAALGACSHPEPGAPIATESPIPVATAAVEQRALPSIYRVSGTVRGRSTATLISKTTAYVSAVHVRAGDRISSGLLLVELEASELRAAVARAQAGLAEAGHARLEAESAVSAARTQAAIAETTRNRSQSLLESGSIAQQQFDDEDAHARASQAQLAMAEAHLAAVESGARQAEAALAEAQARLSYARITAPFTGRVLERRVDPGALANPGTPLLVVADEGLLQVEAAFDEGRAAEVALGDEVGVELDARPEPLRGKVSEIAPSVDAVSRTFLVKIDLPPSAEGLSPGGYARVLLRGAAQPRLVVPSSAVSSLGALDRVFVLDGERVRARMVTLGERSGSVREVLSGLDENERVVRAPQPALCDGARVQVEP